MTPSELKYHVEENTDSYFFDRKSMKFFGDTMKNYGVRNGVVFESHYDEEGNYSNETRTVETWELYRKRPVKCGLKKSAFFDKKTFTVVHPELEKV
jgi:hypothetical protein